MERWGHDCYVESEQGLKEEWEKAVCLILILCINLSRFLSFWSLVDHKSGVIITADQRSVARNELTTDRTKFICLDGFWAGNLTNRIP